MNLLKLAYHIIVWATIAVIFSWLISGCGNDRQESASVTMEPRNVETHLPLITVLPTNNEQSLSPPVSPETPSVTNKAGNLEAATNLEDEIIQIVRHWYATNKLQMPKRMVIRDRNATNWVITTRSDWFEVTFHVDPEAKRVIRSGVD